MTNYKGEGSFKKRGNKSKFEGSRHTGSKKLGGARGQHDRPARNVELFKATCSECGKTCELPFKPSADKPVYCSDCFGRRLSNHEPRGAQQKVRENKSETKKPRDQRSPRHDAAQRQQSMAVADMQRQLTKLEEKLNRILEIINPPVPSQKVPLAAPAEGPKKDRKPKKEKVVKVAPTKRPRKASAKKTKKVAAVKVPPAPKKAVKKTTKKVAKKTVKKATKKAVKKTVTKK